MRFRNLSIEDRVITTALVVTATCQVITVTMFAGLLYRLYFVG